MNTESAVLVGSFIKSKGVPQKIIRNIVEIFSVDQIFIFEIKDAENKLEIQTEDSHNNSVKKKYIVTFNINKQDKNNKFGRYKQQFKNTVQLHRNKDTNTLYTINSLNKLIELQSGKVDRDFKVNWNNYKNSILLLKQDGSLDILTTKLCNIINLPK